MTYAPRCKWVVHCPVCRAKLDWRRDITETAKERVPKTMHVVCDTHGPATVRLEWTLQNPVAKAG